MLGVSDIAGEAIADTLERWLNDRDLLLILDNCEHVVEAAAGLCQRLLPACGRLRILATSREFLDVRGEHAIQTPPLAVPDDLALAPLSDVIGAAGQGDKGVSSELLATADELRRQSGQGHRPWEIRARLGNLEDRIATASAPAPAGGDYSLPAAASLAVRALQSLMRSTAS